MSSYKSKVIELFGEEHWESDEEIVEAESQLRQRLKRAFGSDSEEDNPPLSDVMELSCSDIEEEEEPTSVTVNRLTILPQKEDCLAQRKALAQYQRQMAARVTGQTAKAPIQLPTYVIAQRTGEDKRRPSQEETIASEEELFRTTEKMIYGRTLQQVTEEILVKIHHQPRQAVSTISPLTQPSVLGASTLDLPNTMTGGHRSRKEKRKEAKKQWFLKKKMKPIS